MCAPAFQDQGIHLFVWKLGSKMKCMSLLLMLFLVHCDLQLVLILETVGGVKVVMSGAATRSLQSSTLSRRLSCFCGRNGVIKCQKNVGREHKLGCNYAITGRRVGKKRKM